MKKNKYFFAAIAAYTIWGFFSFVLKPIDNYPSIDILFFRVFIGALVMLVVNLFFRRKIVMDFWASFIELLPRERRNMVILTTGGSLLLIGNWFAFIYVMNHVSVKVASLAYLICPILTAVSAFIILKEKLNVWKKTAVFISAIGCFLISLEHVEDLIYSFIVAITFAIYLVSQRKNVKIDEFLALSIQLIIAGLLLLPFYPKYSGNLPTDMIFYIFLLIIVFLFTIAPLFLNLYALKGINSSTVGIIMYITPIVAFLSAVFYYDEPVSNLQLFSYALIMISIVIFNKKNLFKNHKHR